MLDALCLQHLLSQLAGDNLSLYFRDYTDQALDGKSTKRSSGNKIYCSPRDQSLSVNYYTSDSL